MHLVFYDGQCGFCDHTVQFLLKRDRKKQFLFAPLQGETAKQVLKNLPENYKSEDTLILMENYQTQTEHIYILGKAAFKVCWHLGNFWTLLGLFSFLPGCLYNWAYRLIAKYRHSFFSNVCLLPDPRYADRFLP
jgi:predicted DCC family thiol-disulfide oxidoreductase YuxK